MSDAPRQPRPWQELSARYPRWARPFVAFEWITAWAVYLLQRWTVLHLLNLLGSFSLLAAVISYCAGADERAAAFKDQRTSRQYQAWQALSVAQGKPGNGGRIQALEDLAGDSVSLAGVDVAGAWLQGVQLPNADLSDIRADSADLSNADLQRANLTRAQLNGAILENVDLRGANLIGASLRGVKLHDVCLGGAELAGADLRGVEFWYVSLEGADAYAADLRGAHFVLDVKIDGANFSQADFRGTLMSGDLLTKAGSVGNANVSQAALDTGPRQNFRLSQAELDELLRRGAKDLPADSAWEANRRYLAEIFSRRTRAYGNHRPDSARLNHYRCDYQQR